MYQVSYISGVYEDRREDLVALVETLEQAHSAVLKIKRSIIAGEYTNRYDETSGYFCIMEVKMGNIVDVDNLCTVVERVHFNPSESLEMYNTFITKNLYIYSFPYDVMELLGMDGSHYAPKGSPISIFDKWELSDSVCKEPNYWNRLTSATKYV